jgi:hypothetical protein
MKRVSSKAVVQDSGLIEYLSRRFAIRIARGVKISVNDIPVHKPDGFDSSQFDLFKLDDGSKLDLFVCEYNVAVFD